jgi:hypothetical protein
VAAHKPKPPKSQSGPSGGFDGYDMSFVREREPPQWQQPSSQQSQWGQAQQQWQPAPHHRRGPWGWVLLVAAIIALLVVVLLL